LPSLGIVKRLLLVEDESAVLTALRRYFEAVGYEVSAAPSREAAESMLASAIDGAIVDLCLSPGDRPDGLDVVEAIRRQQPSTRIVVLTALGGTDIEAAALHRGADAFLCKPQPLPHLANVVSRLLAD